MTGLSFLFCANQAGKAHFLFGFGPRQRGKHSPCGSLPDIFSIRAMLQALEHLRRMRGGAQSHLFRCRDGAYYVVKFQNNPQHLRILANEMLATRLAARLGLPVPPVTVVEVSP